MDGFFDAVKDPASQIFRGLYGAPDDPRLSPQGNRNALAQGLTQGGLAMMLGGGSGPPGSVQGPNDFLSLLAQGMLASQQGTVQAQQGQLATQAQARMARLAEGEMTPENLGKMMMSAIGAGDAQSARTISEVLKSMMAGGGGSRMRPQYINRTEGGKRYRIAVDPVTMEEISRVEVDFPVSAFRRYSSVPREDGEYVDDTSTVVRNELSGHETLVQDNPSRPRSEAEARAESFILPLQSAIPMIDQFDENPPPFGQEIYQNWLTGNVASGDMRQLYNAGAIVGEAWLRQTTGAAYNETEYANASLIFVPRYGDSDAVRAQKREMRMALMILTKNRAGKPLSPQEEAIAQSIGNRYDSYLDGVARAYTDAIDSGASADEAVRRAQGVMGWSPGDGPDTPAGDSITFDSWLDSRERN